VRCSALADLFGSLTLRDELDLQSGGKRNRSEQKAAAAAAGSDAPSQQSVSGVRSALFPHQVAGVAWMARRETGQSADGTSPLGGIVADAPGLGKTLMMLALVAQDKKRHAKQQRTEARLDDGRAASRAPQSTDMGTVPSRCTLVVCPRALLRQWERECGAHLEAGLLSVECLMAGSSRAALTAADIARCDVVVTSYETVRSQHQQLLALQRQAAARSHQPSATSSSSTSSEAAVASDVSSVAPLFSVSYLRLIADEAHRLRNRKAQLTAAVCALAATHRWYVTATPLQNHMDDLYPAFLFLRYAPYSDYAVWRQYIHTKDGRGVERCRTLMRALAIRRIKSQQPQHDSRADGGATERREEQGGVQMTAKHVQLVQLNFKPQSDYHGTHGTRAAIETVHSSSRLRVSPALPLQLCAAAGCAA